MLLFSANFGFRGIVRVQVGLCGEASLYVSLRVTGWQLSSVTCPFGRTGWRYKPSHYRPVLSSLNWPCTVLRPTLTGILSHV